MVDYYRGLIKSLMKQGFLFKRQGERKHEIWRNRLTDRHVMFDRDEVATSRAAVTAVLNEASRPPDKPARRAASGRAAASASAARAKAKRSTRKTAKAKAPVKSRAAAKAKRPARRTKPRRMR